MKRYIYTLCFAIAAMLAYTSCMNNDDETREYYNDTAIETFYISAVNRHIHTTTSAGADSVYVETLSDPVVFTIDQYQYKIYNTDSLPSDCDMTRVLAGIATTNSGTAVINYKSSTGADSLMYYASTDSIDFTKVNEIRVYAQDGSGYRAYDISVNVHKAETGKMIWEQKSAADMPADAQRALWEQRVADAGLKQFVGLGSTEAYAFSNDHLLMVTYDEGKNWVHDIIENSEEMMPTANICFASWPFTANDSTDYQLLIGTSDLDDKACVVWRKLSEYALRSLPSQWVLIPAESNNPYYLPKMDNLNLVYFNEEVLAIGNNGKIYLSRDLGITWKTTSKYTLPSNIGTYNLKAFVDDDGYLWLMGKDTGEVWRGIIL